MHAAQTKVQQIIDGERQYVIPLFQRPYSWETPQWAVLWQDLVELCEEENPRTHFIGSIVTIPAKSVPEGVTKYVLIDGQQRLTTLLVLMAAIRDKVRETPGNLAQKIDDILLKNRHQEGTDVYKLLPTQVDRPAFTAIMDGGCPIPASPVAAAYAYFDKRLKLTPHVELERLYNVIRDRLVLVSIVLDADDNPHLIFESLNAKGRPLTQADLIRNFFFMRIHLKDQEKVYAAHWKPMQDRLGDSLTEYIRHYLTRDGKVVRQSDVYVTLKQSVEQRSPADIVAYLQELAAFSVYYAKLLRLEREKSRPIADRLVRLYRYEATTAYPFLLDVYRDYDLKRLPEADFVAILDMLETFLIRRFLCGVVSSGLTKLFPTLYAQAKQHPTLVEGVRHTLKDKSFPRDQQFREAIIGFKLYGGDRSTKAKLILERLEASFGHKEAVDFDKLTIEHVMPRTPTDWWRQQLGEDWEAVHEQWLDTLGNLTLTGYNSELSNSDFPAKQAHLADSHLELNKYFAGMTTWDDQAIALRGEALGDLAVAVWPDFAHREAAGGEAVGEEELQEDVQLLVAAAVDHFGGEVERLGKGPRVFYRTGGGQLLNVKYSKRHSEYYWFGVHASLWDEIARTGVTHLVLILVPDGFAAVPVPVMQQYIADAGFSPKTDGSVRHYHVLVSAHGPPELFHHGKPARIPLQQYYTKFA